MATGPAPTERPVVARRLFYLLAAAALIYALLAGLRTVHDFDLGWQMATGRWILQHHQVPYVDVLSYTAAGEPWTYPIGAGLIFYVAYLVGGYGLISWISAVACAGTVALLLRRGSAVSAAIAIVAVPLIAYRTGARADTFTVVLFAAFLSLLWENYQTGRARLWWLPLLMLAWVNLHFGFAAGLALVAAYVGAEALEVLAGKERRRAALDRLRRAWIWLAFTAAITLANPWGWRLHQAFLRQERANQAQQYWIAEWTPVPFNWEVISSSLVLRQTRGTIYLLVAVAAAAIVAALLRRRPVPAILLAAAGYEAIRHVRMGSIFACVAVVVAGDVLAGELARADWWPNRTGLRRGLALAMAGVLLLLAGVRSFDLVTDRYYFRGVEESNFGTGLGWWFPWRAAEFIRQNQLPGEVLNSYNEGGYLAWKLGPERRVYIDGRDTLYGVERIQHQDELLRAALDSPQWEQEAERYSINTILLSLARADGIQLIDLRDYCNSKRWAPVYLDEVSAVFVRRTAANEEVIRRFPVDCATAPLPAQTPGNNRVEAFNAWANAAGVLSALGRNSEALAANSNALAIFPDSAYLHWNRAEILFASGRLADSEAEYLAAVRLEPSVNTWAALAASYQKRGRYPAALDAMKHEVSFSLRPYLTLSDLGYFYLELRQPENALRAFQEAERKAPSGLRAADNGKFDFTLAQGRSGAWEALGDLEKAIEYQEAAARLAPDAPAPRRRLARLYERAGRMQEAERARQEAAEIAARSPNSGGQ